MIVKIQRSITSSEGPSMLIYNQDRSIMEQLPLPPEMERWFGKRLKRYAEARIVSSQLIIDHEVPDQDW